jgi:cathepsin A (carboxypeptidase C)
MLLTLVISSLMEISAAYTKPALADQVKSLPRSTSAFLSNQFSGYLNITKNKFIHYYYFESERDPIDDSVVFWTNGGPG